MKVEYNKDLELYNSYKISMKSRYFIELKKEQDFFDFYELNKSTLWFLLPLNIKEEAYLIPFSREEFINVHNNDGFDELVLKLIPNIRSIIIDYKRNASRRSINNLQFRSRRRPSRRRF